MDQILKVVINVTEISSQTMLLSLGVERESVHTL